jgi:bifunctional DNA-binding transcriptional regulator/antitoxin component of YhaV-PrlF toxin-antitoxin module
MTVLVKNKEPLVVPAAARRRAGFKSGQELEVKASGGLITIAPKLSRDELQDEREIRDPKIQAMIRDGREEFLAGKTGPSRSSSLLATRVHGDDLAPRHDAFLRRSHDIPLPAPIYEASEARPRF